MEANSEDLLFLKQKIEDIKIALFKAETDSILRLPNNIISTLKADENGYIWFFTSCTGPYVQYLDKELYVSLDYYKKENNCRLIINGKAYIEIDNTEFSKEASYDKMVLLKVKILKAEYSENKTLSTLSLKEKIKTAINYIMAVDTHRMYDFSS